MVMTSFDWVILLGGISGLCMVIGGMVLLYKGAISLAQVSDKSAVSLEFKKMFKITTHYPALGLFVIGLAFIISTAMLSSPKKIPVKITGILKTSDPSAVEVYVYPVVDWRMAPSTDGILEKVVYPAEVNFFKYKVIIPGQIPTEKNAHVNRSGTIELGKIELRDAVSKPPSEQALIDSLDVQLPAIGESGAFQ